MIVDSSALVAIVFGEPDGERFRKAMLEADSLRLSVANWLEASLVVQGLKQPAITEQFDRLIARLGIELMPVDAELARLARAAGLRFGRRHHEAKLNYGDCFAYALAKSTGEPLLFKGEDFARTDIQPALPA